MMRQLRESTKVIMILVSIAFVGLMVFQWGMDLSGRSSRGAAPTSLGSVNGAEVTVDDYQRQYQILLDQAQQSHPQGLSDQELKQIEDQAWQDVVNLTLLRQAAREHGIHVSDAELVQYIKYNPPPDMARMPAFQTEGRFDLQKYQQALADPSLADTWAQYEQQMRRTLPILRLQEQVVAGVTISNAELLQAYRDQNEKARIAYLYLDPARLVPADEVRVSPDEVRAYYESHADDYHRNESAKIRWVAFEPPVTAADSARAAARADSLYAKATAPDADFESLAEDNSDDAISASRGGDLGWVRPAAMAPALARVLTSTEPGQVASPVLTPFGWHVVKVEDRQTQDGETRVKARQILLAIGPSVAERSKAREAAQGFARAASAGPDAYAKAAADRGLEVHEPPAFEKGVVVPGLGAAPKVTDFVFSNSAGAVSGALDQDGTFYVVEVENRYPAGTVALARVEPEIRAALQSRKRLEATRKLAPEIADAVRSGGLEGAAAKYGLEVRTTDWFTRTNNIPGVGSGTALAGAAFGLSEGQTAGPVETERGLYFLRVLGKQPIDPQQFQSQKDQLRAQLRRAKMQETFNSWFDALKDQARIVDHRKELLGA